MSESVNIKEVLEKHLKYLNCDADGERADLSGADLRCANLRGADLRGADISYANLSGVDLSGADLRCANLRGADISGAILPNFSVCPEIGAFDAYKKVGIDTILHLRIPADAKRVSSLVGRKCRASKVKVLAVVHGSTTDMTSRHDCIFQYKVGKMHEPSNGFDDDIRVECAAGIHFFMTLKESMEY
jgi:hypothetical protein